MTCRLSPNSWSGWSTRRTPLSVNCRRRWRPESAEQLTHGGRHRHRKRDAAVVRPPDHPQRRCRAAVDVQYLAGDRASQVGAQEQHGIGEVVGAWRRLQGDVHPEVPVPPVRGNGSRRRAQLIGQRILIAGARRRVRRDQIDANSFRAQFPGHRLGIACRGGLGAGIDRETTGAAMSFDGREINDAAAAATTPNQWNRAAHRIKHIAVVAMNVLQTVRARFLHERLHQDAAHHVHHDIQPRKLGGYIGVEFLELPAVERVGGHGDCTPATSLNVGSGDADGSRVDVAKRHVDTRLRERKGHCPADSAAAADNRRGFAGQAGSLSKKVL